MGEMKPLVVGFGHRMQVGKDTAVEAIQKAYPDAKRYAFADALKIEVYDALLDDNNPFWEFLDNFNAKI